MGVIPFRRRVRRPALAAVPLAQKQPVPVEVSSAAWGGGCFGDIETSRAVGTQIGQPGETASSLGIIEPFLATAPGAIGFQQLALGRETLHLLRAGQVHEQLSRGAVGIDAAWPVQVTDQGRRSTLFPRDRHNAVAGRHVGQAAGAQGDALRTGHLDRVQHLACRRVVPAQGVALRIGDNQDAGAGVHVGRVHCIGGLVPLNVDADGDFADRRAADDAPGQLAGRSVVGIDELLAPLVRLDAGVGGLHMAEHVNLAAIHRQAQRSVPGARVEGAPEARFAVWG